MTQEEISDVLIKLSAKKVARFQHRDPAYSPPSDLPQGIESDICALVWYVGAKPSRDELIKHGATAEQADIALATLKKTLGIIEPSELRPIPVDFALTLQSELRDAFAAEPADGLQPLDERVIDWITEYRVEIYSNESQHRGRPHVVVVLPGGKISVSLDDPPTILTPHGYRGEASALKVVTKHRDRLLDVWHTTRPDDQKLPSKT